MKGARLPRRVRHGLAAGAAGAVLSGAPSTLFAAATGRDPLEATYAAGTVVLSESAPKPLLVLAAAAGHTALSLGWGVALAYTLPRRHTAAAGAVAGLGIAWIGLGTTRRMSPAIRRLPLAPQVADHVAFGAVAGATIGLLRRLGEPART